MARIAGINVSDNKHTVITPKKAHQLEYEVTSEKVGRGRCKCGKNRKDKKKIICKSNCGCIKNQRPCTSACGCTHHCPNRVI